TATWPVVASSRPHSTRTLRSSADLLDLRAPAQVSDHLAHGRGRAAQLQGERAKRPRLQGADAAIDDLKADVLGACTSQHSAQTRAIADRCRDDPAGVGRSDPRQVITPRLVVDDGGHELAADV